MSVHVDIVLPIDTIAAVKPDGLAMTVALERDEDGLVQVLKTGFASGKVVRPGEAEDLVSDHLGQAACLYVVVDRVLDIQRV